MPRTSLAELAAPADSLICVLEQLEKPGNLGAVVRTAAAAGVGAVIVADAHTDLFNPNAIRASLGAIFQLPVCAASAEDTQNWLAQRGGPVYATRVDASVPYTHVDYRGPCAVVLGSEARGLSETWQGPSVQPIALPMLGPVDSLNVSVTAAVVFYEALRQRQSS
jgi:TrmH family RNA methyltransferase